MTMTTFDLLSRLRDLGVTLWVDGDQLRFRAPDGVMTPSLRAELVSRKSEIVAFLFSAKTAVSIEAPLIQPVSRETELPLSYAQQRLWFLDQLVPHSPFYNIPAAVQLTGCLDIKALRYTFAEIVRRHEVLRTTFATVGRETVQVIAPAVAIELPVVDLRALTTAEQETESRRLAIEEARRPFDLSRGPLLRVALLCLDASRFVVLLTMHHIVSDGWSVGVLVQEVAALYEAFSRGQPSPLPDLPVQYADFAVWQRKWLQGEVLERQIAYWKGRLYNLPLLELPADRPRPPVQTYRGTRQSFVLPRPLAEALQTVSQREGVTLFMTLLAAFKALLHRYTGQEDIVVGTPIANRNRDEIEGLIGFFVNTLVLRTELSDSLTFRELLGRVREVTLGAYAHQDLPFEMLVDELKPARDLSRSPLFQVMFIHQNAPMTMKVPGLTLDLLVADNGAAQFDLTLSMEECEQGLAGTLAYSTDLFDAATISRLIGHFRVLLESAVADPGQRLSDLALLTDAERRQLLVEWNDTRTEYPQEQCLHEPFEAQVKQTPDAVAVVFEDHHLTYRQLNRRANQLAHYLQEMGVEPETLVSICLERSSEMMVGLLGILKAGGAYLPLDPMYPQERLAFMLEDSRSPVLLTQSQLLDKLLRHQARAICLDADGAAIARMPYTAPTRVVTADNLAYTIYTSGSTGRPKGVQIPHHAVVNFLHSMRQKLDLREMDVVLSVTTLSFDIAGLELFLPLVVGGRVELASRAVAADGAQLMKELSTSGATAMQATPATWRLLLGAGWQAGERLKALCGGERMSRGLADQLLTQGIVLWNLYGPTETTIWSSAYKVEAVDGPVSIGRPIDNTQICLLDSHLQPVPVGVPGELYIGGDGLARGYLNHPDLTSERFIPNPYPLLSMEGGQRRGQRLYRTGDLARYLPDGNIEFLGRIDHQVKVRGFRIELGEIEAMLSQHPQVRETVVVAREDGAGPALTALGVDKRLVAYVVASDGCDPTVNEMRRFLQEKLPDYMIPSVFVMLAALPLTPNGKVDRRALPAPDQSRPSLEQVYIAPASEAERAIAAVWRDVLQVERVGVHDNFFDLGGHSLLMVQAHRQLMTKLGVEFPMADLFKHTTIAALARHLSGTTDQVDIVQRRKARAAARRAWLHERIHGSQGAESDLASGQGETDP
jgi:amino acid adenylation domain-containing protein